MVMASEFSPDGHCLCGKVEFELPQEHSWACFCHCKDCTRNCASPVTAFIGVALDQFKWRVEGQHKAPKYYVSSPGVKRFFCDNCGTPMAFQAEHYVNEIHLYAATLNDPEQFIPAFHVHYASKLKWLPVADDLTKFAHSAEDHP